MFNQHSDEGGREGDGANGGTGGNLDRRFLLGGLTGLAGVAGIAALAQISKAGPLSPPVGAVGSTGKTLQEVEPRTPLTQATTPSGVGATFRITQPGSYYLTANLAIAASARGILVDLPAGTSGGVSIDLNGFTISAPPSSPFARGVVQFSTSAAAVRVFNGTLINCGVLIDGSAPVGGGVQRCFEDLVIVSASESGIISSAAAIFRRCTVNGAPFFGLSGGPGSRYESCMVQGCVQSGIAAGSGSASIIDCVAQNNPGTGILIYENALVRGCYLLANGSSGVQGSRAAITALGTDSTIEGNVCIDNNYGIEVTFNRNIIIANRVARSTTRNYEIAAGNRYGPIVDVSAGGGAAVSGAAAAGNLGSSDPHANWSY